MYEFIEQNRKYHVICTEDRKNYILVGHTPEEIQEFAKENGLEVRDTDPRLYIVHVSHRPDLFMFSVLSLIRRLKPMGQYAEMYPWFYRTKKMELIAKGTYLAKPGTECPFLTVDPERKDLTAVTVPTNA